AQIEAARAGEMGKGFAVVATEVNRLSTAISEAVADMDIISLEAVDAVNTLLKCSSEMSDFITENVISDYDSFAELGEKYGLSTTSLKDSMHDLKKQSEEIVQAVETIDSSMAGISTAISDSANEVSELAKASQDMTDNMTDLQNISRENEDHSNELKNMVGQYKY
nr:hypothetical protein [Lachnospiraceae bacterium]